MTASFDIMEFAVAEKQIDTLVPGKVYEFSYERPGESGPVTVSKVFYVKSVEKDGWRVLTENKFSDWSDSDGIVASQSQRKFHAHSDMYSMAGKTIKEYGIRDTKTFVKNCLKSFSVRTNFGLPPVKRVLHGEKVDVKFN